MVHTPYGRGRSDQASRPSDKVGRFGLGGKIGILYLVSD